MKKIESRNPKQWERMKHVSMDIIDNTEGFLENKYFFSTYVNTNTSMGVDAFMLLRFTGSALARMQWKSMYLSITNFVSLLPDAGEDVLKKYAAKLDMGYP